MNHSITQTILSTDYESFIIYKKFSDSVGIITTFQYDAGRYKSDLKVPVNRLHRIEEFHSLTSDLTEYDIVNNLININCINTIDVNTGVFDQTQDLISGIFHYDFISKELVENNKEVIVCEVNPRLLIKSEEELMNSFELDINQFETDKLKIFSIIMMKGFILCIVDSNRTTITICLNKPSENYIGTCLQLKNWRILNSIQLLWPIFRFEPSKSVVNIFNECEHISIDEKYPVVIKLERILNERMVHSQLIGKSLYIK